jgi:hypothetical protein
VVDVGLAALGVRQQRRHQCLGELFDARTNALIAERRNGR